MKEKPVDHSAMSACGYVKPWSIRAGGQVSLHASASDPAARVSLKRLDKPDDVSVTTWIKEPGDARLEHRTLTLGSWIELHGLVPAATTHLQLEILLTVNSGFRTLVAWGGISINLDTEGRLMLSCGSARALADGALPRSRWLRLSLSLADGRATASVDGLAGGGAVARLDVPWVAPASPAVLMFGMGESGPAANWRVGRIALTAPGVDAEWRFPTRGPVDRLAPARGRAPELRICNDPTFSCASARWDGSIHDPRLAADHYDALHLHEDDLGPLGWPAVCRLSVPDDAESGIYAFVLTTRDGLEEVPFFVRPARPRAVIAFLVPTLTYAAYADEALPEDRYPWACDERSHRFAQANGLLSLYDVHADGSGVSLKSLDHPKATLRSDYRYPLSDSAHLLPVDLQLLRFCHDNGIAFDLLTDGDLHEEGTRAIRPYAGLFTGSHPEYWTTRMQDALQRWLGTGGNLAYLGGNGFMWVTACIHGRVEVRRGQRLASRTWDGLPGELNLATTGEFGGLWRDRGRSEFSVTGTGMTLMGFGPARAFHRLEASHDPTWAWIFAGTRPGPIGDHGQVLGGAAGYEVDRTDTRLGTPDGTVILARAEGFGPDYEVDGNDYFPGGASERKAARRADMTVRRHEGGGFVFSAGSVAWCGALPPARDANNVGTITLNILRRLGSARLP